MIKEYVKQSKALDPKERFSNFQFLFYLSKVIDLQTVLNIC